MGGKELHYGAPVVPVDYDHEDYGGDIWPCHDCLPWHAEVIWLKDEARVIIREWHAEACPSLAVMLDEGRLRASLSARGRSDTQPSGRRGRLL